MTDENTEFAETFLRRHARDKTTDKRPFFVYLPFTAPHAPLEAPQEIVDKYLSLYKQSWWRPTWRERQRNRFEKALQEGVVRPHWQISEPNPGIFKFAQRVLNDIVRDMATHAAMMEIMDRNIGVLIDTLDKTGELDNTIILYLSDNGAAGPHHSLANTPFQGQKGTLWEGGIRTHMVLWGQDFRDRAGDVIFEPVHVIDILPTLMDLLDMDYPQMFKERDLEPLPGKSFLDGLISDKWPDRGPLYWDLTGYKAVIDGKWKYLETSEGETFLFDLTENTLEVDNLAEEFPEKLKKLKTRHEEWARENNVLPWDVVRRSQRQFADEAESSDD